MASALAYRGIPPQSAYCGSKHALQGFHESLRNGLLHDKSNVRITMVSMPAVNISLWASQHHGTLARIAAGVAAGMVAFKRRRSH